MPPDGSDPGLLQSIVSAEPEYTEGQIRDRRRSALGRVGRWETLLIGGVLIALVSVFFGNIIWRALA